MNLSNSEAGYHEWAEKQLAKFIEEHGSVPPPWVMFPDTHPYDIIWRMGAGESHLMVFHQWWMEAKKDFDENQRIQYFQKWPPPPRWLPWMIDVIWDLDPLEMDDPEAFDYAPYFARTKALGLGTQAEYEQDIHDPRWLED